MGGSVISTLSFVLVVLWWVNCFLVGNHLSTCPHEISCRYADGWLYRAIVCNSVHGLWVKGMGRNRVVVVNPFMFFLCFRVGSTKQGWAPACTKCADQAGAGKGRVQMKMC